MVGVGTLLATDDIRFAGDSDGDSDSDSDSDSDGDSDSDSDSDSDGDSDSDSDSDGDSDSDDPPAPFFLADATRLSLISSRDVDLDKDRPMRGVIRAGRDVKLARNVFLEGVVVADGKIDVDKNTRIIFLNFDQTPPLITNLLPAIDAVVREPTPNVGATYTDDRSGVDPSSVTLLLDGVDRTQEATVTTAGIVFSRATVPGEHQVELGVADNAGNLAQVDWSFTLVAGPPEVVIEHPAEGSFTSQDTVEVHGTVTGGGPIVTVLVNDQPATLDGEDFTITLQLEEGFNTILVLATDTFGGLGVAGVGLFLDTEPPQVTLSAPEPGQLVNGDSVRLAGEALDSSYVESVFVDGVAVDLVGSLFTADVELPEEGPKTITVEAVDLAGNSVEISRQVVRFSLPEVAITTPGDLAIVAATTLTVAGTVSDDVVAVAVDGVSATLAGTGFTASGIPLAEGGNTVTATATNAAGRVATATIHVARDLTSPRVMIHRPLDSSRTREGTISVSGLVNDIVPGTVNSSEATVTVNGMPAEVVNRSFLVAARPLAPGENSVVAQAVDAVGNVGEHQITVTLDAGPTPRLRVVSGNHQQGVIGTVLPEPLVVEILDADGQPAVGTPVVFRLRGNDGSLDGGKRQTAAVSDASGRAQVTFSLGNRAGVGNQVVEASAVGFAGPAVFLASALPGEPELVVVDAGGQQVGVAGRQVPRPLIAAVVDAGRNRLGGVSLLFQVTQGRGHFAGGSQETVVVSDSDGRAIVSYVLDSAEGIGNNAVNASIVGLEDGYSATFIASSRAAGDPAATSISGVVLDNTNVPVAGATLRIRQTSLTAVSDLEGQFRIEGAPVGAVDLIVDGSTVARPGAWPDLEFDLVTIAGRDNTVNMPIYLLPLDLENGIYVDETRGGTLTLDRIPGFALEVQPGSVTFPGGGNSGQLSVTVVHNDKVPMVPNFGQQPRLIVTIQPAGARFEPPARLTLPNVDGLAPGQVTEMYSFDHDLGHFVSIGPATVSDDATVVRSDPGVGVVKAGWHCGSDPVTDACLHKCPECQDCRDPPCKCDILEDLCSDCTTPGSACDGEGECKTGRQLIPKICEDRASPGGGEETIPGLGQTEENEGFVPCSEIPQLEGHEGLCGSGVGVTYTMVTHSCDGVDLEGAEWREEVTTDDGCEGIGEVIMSGQTVQKGNRLAPEGKFFRDYYWACKPKELLGDDFVCAEVLTQKIWIDDCPIATKEITLAFLFEIDENGEEECVPTWARDDIDPGEDG